MLRPSRGFDSVLPESTNATVSPILPLRQHRISYLQLYHACSTHALRFYQGMTLRREPDSTTRFSDRCLELGPLLVSDGGGISPMRQSFLSPTVKSLIITADHTFRTDLSPFNNTQLSVWKRFRYIEKFSTKT